MKNSTPKTAAGRLAAAHKKRDDLAAQIEDAEAARKAALLAADDRVARLVDLNLVELRMAAQREADRVVILSPLAEAERREMAWPQDVVGLKAKLLEMERRQRALSAKPRVDRSAAEDHELESIIFATPGMKAHLEILQGMAA
jgi:hypothetical protein